MEDDDVGAQGGDAEIAVLRTEVGQLRATVKDHDKILLGNGRPGLVQTVARLEAIVMGLEVTARRIDDSAARQAQAAARTELAAKGIAAAVVKLSKKVSAIEATVAPIIEWKKGIIIRITTVVATASAILGGLWWVVENFDKIKAVLQ